MTDTPTENTDAQDRHIILTSLRRAINATRNGIGGALTLFHNIRRAEVTEGIEAAAREICKDPILTAFILNTPILDEDYTRSLYPNVIEQLTTLVDPDEFSPPQQDTARGYARMLWYFQESERMSMILDDMVRDPNLPLSTVAPMITHPVVTAESSAGYISMRMAMAFTEFLKYDSPTDPANIIVSADTDEDDR